MEVCEAALEVLSKQKEGDNFGNAGIVIFP
jgi:hypothetical protein